MKNNNIHYGSMFVENSLFINLQWKNESKQGVVKHGWVIQWKNFLIGYLKPSEWALSHSMVCFCVASADGLGWRMKIK